MKLYLSFDDAVTWVHQLQQEQNSVLLVYSLELELIRTH